jgi:hypothetical protein
MYCTIFTPTAPPRKPQVTTVTFIRYDHNLSSSISRLYYLEWKPPGNTDKLVIANYLLQTRDETIWIDRKKTHEYFHTSESVSTGTFMAVSICGTSANVTLNFPHSYFVTTATSVAAPQTVNQCHYDTLLIVVPLVIGLFLFAIVLILIAILIVYFKWKNDKKNNSLIN